MTKLIAAVAISALALAAGPASAKFLSTSGTVSTQGSSGKAAKDNNNQGTTDVTTTTTGPKGQVKQGKTANTITTVTTSGPGNSTKMPRAAAFNPPFGRVRPRRRSSSRRRSWPHLSHSAPRLSGKGQQRRPSGRRPGCQRHRRQGQRQDQLLRHEQHRRQRRPAGGGPGNSGTGDKNSNVNGVRLP